MTSALSPEIQRSTVKRRCQGWAAGSILLLLLLVVGVPGILVWLDPVSAGPVGWLPVTELDQVPADGTPRMFTVYRSGQDAWSRSQPEPVTAVYLLRQAESDQITALPMVPPCGCFLRYSPELQRFQCPCHY